MWILKNAFAVKGSMDSITSKILYNVEIAPGFFRLGLEWKSGKVVPGQFVMVRVSNSCYPLLRRPFGIYKVLNAKPVKGGYGCRGTGVELLYNVVGRGTELLSTRPAGETVGLLGPIGNGFPVIKKERKVIMCAGGIGTVPFYLIASSLGERSTLLVGARSKEALTLAQDFRALKCKVGISTEDGSVGTRGLVTGLLKKELKRAERDGETAPDIYACGPIGMLRAVAGVAEAAGADCFVSLERSMACGIGVCLGCAVKSSRHAKEPSKGPEYAMVCSDGPVFNGGDVEWERL